MSSSPAKWRKTSETTSAAVLPNAQDGTRRTSTRPSFMSPTKASLARFNPSLLPRPTSAGSDVGRPDARSELIARGQQALAYIRGESASALSPVIERPVAPSRDYTTQDGATDQLIDELLESTPREIRQSLSDHDNASDRNLIGVDEEEAELPLTPAEQGLVDPEPEIPPRGILFSSPSRRRRKNWGDKTRSSSLKPQILPPAQPGEAEESDNAESTELQATAGAKAFIPEGGVNPQQSPSPLEERSVDPAQKEKEKEKERLLGHLQGIRNEVKRYDEALLETYSAGVGVVEDSGLDDLLSMLVPDYSSADPPSQAPPISRLLASFLPFSKPLPQSPTPPPSSPLEPVPSHYPVEVEDELPHLQVFTPLTFESDVTVPLSTEMHGSTSEERGRQRHDIGIRSPSDLLTARIAMTIDTTTHNILDLKLQRLSSWAEDELGVWVRKRIEGDSLTSKDYGSIGWAMGRYWETTRKRAECWVKCHSAFPDLLRGRNRLQSEVGKRSADDREAIAGVGLRAVQDNLSRSNSHPKIRMKELRKHLGSQNLTFRSCDVVLVVSWRIGFDWTGDVESEIGVDYSVPRASAILSNMPN
ncbi:hypothetical protein LTR04_001340 [Oleoguttula sp. CCFEE 6159]|nr:hypothetical protein LTR04_001340 [Oleoguttula sp. CCFEE 6159]